MVAKIGIKPVVSEQLPSFVAEDNPVFVAFMEAYFEYVEQQNQPMNSLRYAKDFVDSDAMLGDFISAFFEEMKSIPSAVVADKQLLAKHIYELYQSKGTIKSYELLFRLLFGESCTIYLPKEDMIRVSGGHWQRQTVIRCKGIQGNPFELTGRQIFQYNDNVIVASAIVDSVTSVSKSGEDYFTLYLSAESLLSNFNDLSLIGSDDIKVVPLQVPKILSYRSRGSLYRQGQTINLYETVGEGAELFIRNTLPGKIEHCLILDGGSGYSVGQTLPVTGSGSGAIIKVKTVDEFGTITSVDIWNGGQGYYMPPVITDFDDFNQVDRCKIICVGNDIGRIGEVTHKALGFGYEGDPVGIFDTNVIVANQTGVFLQGEAIEILDDRIFLENFSGILFEDGDTLISETSEAIDPILTLKSIEADIAIVSGIMEDIYFALEDEGRLLMEDGAIAELEISTDNIQNKTFIGSVSGAKASIIFNNPSSLQMGFGIATALSGRYVNDDSKISEAGKRIQDSYYYQDFSYVIRSGISIDKYKNVVQALLHPVGTKMFGAIQIESRLSLSLGIVSGLFQIIRRIVANYFMNRIELAHHSVKIRHEKFAPSSAMNSYYWLEHMKFGLDNQQAGVNGSSLTVQTYSDQTFIKDNSSPIAHYGDITFESFYDYSFDESLASFVASENNDRLMSERSFGLVTEDSIITQTNEYILRKRNRMWAWPSYRYPRNWLDENTWNDSDIWYEP